MPHRHFLAVFWARHVALKGICMLGSSIHMLYSVLCIHHATLTPGLALSCRISGRIPPDLNYFFHEMKFYCGNVSLAKASLTRNGSVLLMKPQHRYTSVYIFSKIMCKEALKSRLFLNILWEFAVLSKSPVPELPSEE